MVNLLITVLIACIVLGFLYWVWTLLVPLLARFVAEPFLSIVKVLVVIIFVAIAIFYILIPFLRGVGIYLPHVG